VIESRRGELDGYGMQHVSETRELYKIFLEYLKEREF
jgi:hypothetical protein